MELLVATLAYTLPGRDQDGLVRIRFVSDTLRSAVGLINTRLYRSRANDSYYFLLTTWEDEEGWQRAQERYNPKGLILNTLGDLLKAPPEQWYMHYLWGYSRPTAEPTLAAAHVVTVAPDQAERTQRSWIESARRQAIQPTLAFAFLARGSKEFEGSAQPPSTPPRRSGDDGPNRIDSTFLSLLSWPGEAEREEFYADPTYQSLNRYLSSVGAVQVLALDPM